MHATEFAPHLLITTQPSLRDCNFRIHAVAFDLSSIHAASFKPLHPLSSTRTSLYSRRCIDATAAQHPEDVVRKIPKDSREGVTVRVCIEIETVAVTYATLCTCRRLQLNKMPGHNVLCVAARRGAEDKVASMQ